MQVSLIRNCLNVGSPIGFNYLMHVHETKLNLLHGVGLNSIKIS